jgi:hypothetical protein
MPDLLTTEAAICGLVSACLADSLALTFAPKAPDSVFITFTFLETAIIACPGVGDACLT